MYGLFLQAGLKNKKIDYICIKSAKTSIKCTKKTHMFSHKIVKNERVYHCIYLLILQVI